MAEEFDFSKELKEIFESYIKPESITTVVENEQNDPNWNNVKIAANILLKKVNEYKIQAQIKNKSLFEAFNKKIEDLTFNQVQAVYEAAIDFDTKLTKYFGQPEKKLLYVFQDSKGNIKTYELPLSTLPLFIRNSDYRIGGIHRNSSLKDYLKNYMEKDKEEDAHIKRSRLAVLGIQNRLQRYKEKFNQPTISGAILMWKEERRWQLARIASDGDIKEAYAQSIMEKHKDNCDICNTQPGGPEYYSHELIKVFFNNYLKKITNAPAIKGEDIQLGEVQYAVKSGGAELPGINQYILAATACIVLEYPNKVRQFIDNAFNNGKTRNEIIGTSNEIVSKGAKSVVDELITIEGKTMTIGGFVQAQIDIREAAKNKNK